MRKAKAVYSVLAIARKSVTITCILVNTEAGSRVENLYSRQKGYALQICPDCKLLAPESCRQAD